MTEIKLMKTLKGRIVWKILEITKYFYLKRGYA